MGARHAKANEGGQQGLRSGQTPIAVTSFIAFPPKSIAKAELLAFGAQKRSIAFILTARLFAVIGCTTKLLSFAMFAYTTYT